jgi:hypothetical protein
VALSEFMLLLVVVFVLLPAALKNFTAFGLLLVYAGVQSTYYLTGASPPMVVQWLCDITVLAMIYMKPPSYDCFPYRSVWHLLCAVWLERSWCDRVIIACFVAGLWPAYLLLDPTSATYWWTLYWLSLTQYLVAAYAALFNWRSAKASSSETDNPSTPVSLRLSWGMAGGP